MRKPAAPKAPHQQNLCGECGAQASHGLGPPAWPDQLWFCEYHWLRRGEAQAMISGIMQSLGADNDDHQEGAKS